MKVLRTAMAIALAAVLAGCGEEEPDITDQPVLKREAKKIPNMKVLGDFYKATGIDKELPDDPNSILPPSQAKRIVASVVKLKDTSARAEDPQAIFNEVSNKLAAKIKEAESKQLWTYIEPYTQAYKMLKPEDGIFDAYITRARAQMTRPRIALRGFYHDHNSGQTTAVIKVYYPLTRETTDERIRLGEEIGGIKFTKVIGKDDGVELELTSTGQVFQVMKGDDLR